MSKNNYINFDDCLKKAKEQMNEIENTKVTIKEKRVNYFVVPTGNQYINLKENFRIKDAN